MNERVGAEASGSWMDMYWSSVVSFWMKGLVNRRPSSVLCPSITFTEESNWPWDSRTPGRAGTKSPSTVGLNVNVPYGNEFATIMELSNWSCVVDALGSSERRCLTV